MRIAIVEDETLIALGFQVALEEYGHEIVGTETNLASAARCITEQGPELVVLDLHLKNNENGLQLCRQIKADQQTVVIVITAYGDQATTRQALAAGADEVLKKPVSDQRLAACVNQYA